MPKPTLADYAPERPKKEKTVTTSFRVRPEINRMLDAVAEELQRTRTDVFHALVSREYDAMFEE